MSQTKKETFRTNRRGKTSTEKIEQSQRESERHNEVTEEQRLIRRTQRQRGSQLTDEQREIERTVSMNKRFSKLCIIYNNKCSIFF